MAVSKSTVPFALLFTLVLSIVGSGQNAERSPGVRLFENGDFTGAIEALKKSDDLVELNYLGAAYEKTGKEKEARNAFDRSFRAGYKEFGDEIIKRSSFEAKRPAPEDKLSTYLEKNTPRIVVAAWSARRSIDLKGPSTKENQWLMRARMFSEVGRILLNGQMVYSGREIDIDAKISAKPRPGYTDLARATSTQGTVELLVLLDADGGVKGAIATHALPNGLTEQSYIAAGKVRFTPAQRAGRPVAVLKTLTYSFAIY